MQNLTRPILLVTVLLAFGVYARAQSPVPESNLRVVDTLPVQGMSPGSTMGTVRCDAEGNAYLRFYNPAALFQAPVVRISADGEGKQQFSLGSVPGFDQAQITSFAIGPNGDVALATLGGKDANHANIFMFKADGTPDADATIKLGAVNIFQMAIFSNGNLLLSGTREAKLYGKNEPSVSVPFTKVLDDAGEVVKELELPGDYSPPKPSDKTFQKSVGMQPAAITLGDVVAGTDGNVYLTRHYGSPAVYVIAADGSLLRKLTLVPPESSTSLGGLHYSATGGGQLAMAFLAKHGDQRVRMISVYSASSGKRLADYLAPREVGSGLACYTPNGLTFIGVTGQGQFAMKEVRPE